MIKNYNNNTENIKCFDNISEYLIKSNLLEKKEGFWPLIEKNNLDTISILNIINNPKNFDSIGSAHKILKNCDIFCIKYKLKRICNLCSYKIEKEEFYNSYISFNNDELTKFNKIEDKLIDLLLIDDCSCPACGINFVKKIINEDMCGCGFKIIFTFDVEIYGNNSLNYDNLKNNQYNIRNLIKYKIYFNNINYILIGAINMPYYNH